MTQLRNLTHDFVRRTKANLKTIERLTREAPESHDQVTQLINSCVGLLFVPTEDQLERLQNTDISLFLGEARPPQILFGNLKYDNVAGLVRYLRNAFAHLNFDFEYADNRVLGVYLWNVDGNRLVNWVAYLRVEDLRDLLMKLADHYLKVVEPNEANGARLTKLEALTGRKFRLTNWSGT